MSFENMNGERKPQKKNADNGKSLKRNLLIGKNVCSHAQELPQGYICGVRSLAPVTFPHT